MDTIKSCCFTGHRAEKLAWGSNENDPRCIALKKSLADILASLFQDGFGRFYCGMATGCDLYFGEAVVALRSSHPEISLYAVIPFEKQAANWDNEMQKRYYRLAAECDRQIVVHKSYTPDCMMERNRFMVDHSELVIAAYNGEPGGTRNTMLYAMRQNKPIIQISL